MQAILTRRYWSMRWRLLNPVKSPQEHSLGNPWFSQPTSSVELMMTVFLPLNESLSPSVVLVWPPSLDLLNSVYATLFLMMFLGIIYRHDKSHQWLFRFTIGLFTNWERFLVPWVTGLKHIKLPEKSRSAFRFLPCRPTTPFYWFFSELINFPTCTAL